MSDNILIIESPGKIKKIQAYLPNYTICASVGHIRDLDKDGGVDVENNFKPLYTLNTDKKIVIKNLKSICSKECNVFLATDLDLEGEAIAESLRDVLKLKKYKRITFNEITKKALEDALKNHRLINDNMVNAQKTRRILDRLAGYKISPLIQNVFKQKLGAGRVQSVIVRLIIDKENKIKEFFDNKSTHYYHIYGNYLINNSNLYCTLYDSDKKNIIKIEDQDKVISLIQKIALSKWSIHEITNKETYREPNPPFITSTLQQEASTKLGVPIKTIMTMAQRLYESGRITYMRTDSTKLSDDAHSKIKQYINSSFGNKYYKYKQYSSKNSQEAHEAIRPTDFNVTDLGSNDLLNKLYVLIWKRTIASQMAKAIFDVMTTIIKGSTIEEFMIGKVNTLKFDGYLKVYNDIDEIDTQIDNITLNSKVKLVELIGKQNIQQPPPRYNEALLVKKLESLNIGRPSTYAFLISRVQEHNYVEIKDVDGEDIKTISYSYKPELKVIKESESIIKVGKEKKKMVSTEIGYKVTEFLLKNFPKLMDYKFTADLETDLDKISEGKLEWTTVLKKFYDDMIDSINNYVAQNDIIVRVPSKFEIVGKHTNKQNIYYLITKYGPAIKVQHGGKDIFVNVKEKPNVTTAIKLLTNKIKSKK